MRTPRLTHVANTYISLAGIATHYVHSSKIQAIIDEISASNCSLTSICSIIDNYSEEIQPEEWKIWRFGNKVIPAISRYNTELLSWYVIHFF